MNGTLVKMLCTFTIVFFSSSLQNAISESLRYIDESGNIFFVDSLSEVPPKYRIQVNPPTPTPSLSKKQAAKYQSELKKLQHKKQQALRKQEQERREQIRKQERLNRQSASSNKNTTTVTQERGSKKQIPLFFTSPNCEQCKQTEAFLNKNGIAYTKHDIVKSAVSFQLFDALDVGSELPVTKFGTTIIKGFDPDALLAAYKGKPLAAKTEDLTTSSSSAQTNNENIEPIIPNNQ